MSKTKNTILNLFSSYLSGFLVIILRFVTRTVFIKYLGSEYLGISGLFTNILSFLSLSELGISTAIVFALYEPIEKRDEKKIRALMVFYKNVYIIIGFIIAALGLVLIPFLPILIKDYNAYRGGSVNLVFIFLLYLFQSVSSYWFFAYKQSIITANEKSFILNNFNLVFTILLNALQIVALAVFKDFILYTVVSIVVGILQNIIYAILANRMYPFLKQKSKEEKLSKAETKNLFIDCGSLMIYKVFNVVVNTTGNIILSAIKGLVIVGLYSNYRLLFTNVSVILQRIFPSFAASLGNLHAKGDKVAEFQLFETVNYITSMVFGTAGVCFFVLFNDFITVWIGSEWVVEGMVLPMLLAVEIYFCGNQAFTNKFRESFGMFQQQKFLPIVGIVINLVISIVLTKYIGIPGVVIGTILAGLFTMTWYNPYIILKLEFNKGMTMYTVKNVIYLLATVVAAALSYFVCTLFPTNGWIAFIGKGCICVFISLFVFIVGFFYTGEFKYLVSKLKGLVLRKRNAH